MSFPFCAGAMRVPKTAPEDFVPSLKTAGLAIGHSHLAVSRQRVPGPCLGGMWPLNIAHNKRKDPGYTPLDGLERPGRLRLAEMCAEARSNLYEIRQSFALSTSPLNCSFLVRDELRMWRGTHWDSHPPNQVICVFTVPSGACITGKISAGPESPIHQSSDLAFVRRLRTSHSARTF